MFDRELKTQKRQTLASQYLNAANVAIAGAVVSLWCAFVGSFVAANWPWQVYLPQQTLEPLPAFIPMTQINTKITHLFSWYQLKSYGGLKINDHLEEAQKLVQDFQDKIQALPLPLFPVVENQTGIVTSCILGHLCLATLYHLFEGLNTTLPVGLLYAQSQEQHTFPRELHQKKKTHCNGKTELWLSKAQTQPKLLGFVQEQFSGKGLRIKFFEDYNQKYRQFFGPAESLYKKKAAFEVKLQALVCSSFQNVLWVDADLFLLQDGSVLESQCKEKGVNALFWRDMSGIHPENPIWKVLGIDPIPDRAQESGIVWINKAETWRALYLAAFFNVKQSVFYRLLWGDKDTFFLAYEHMKVPYTMMPFAPYTVGTSSQCQIAFIQPDLNGSALALHLVSGKRLVLSKIEHGEDPFKTVAVFDPSCACTIAGVHRLFKVLKTVSSCRLSYLPADEALGSMHISVLLALKKASRLTRFY